MDFKGKSLFTIDIFESVLGVKIGTRDNHTHFRTFPSKLQLE